MLHEYDEADVESEEHYDEDEEYDFVPHPHQLRFGNIELMPDYREALHEAHPHYTVEQIIQTSLGCNVEFPSMEEYMREYEQMLEDEEEESESKDGESEDDEWLVLSCSASLSYRLTFPSSRAQLPEPFSRATFSLVSWSSDTVRLEPVFGLLVLGGSFVYYL